MTISGNKPPKDTGKGFSSVGDFLKADLTKTGEEVRKKLERQVGTIYLLDDKEISLVSLELFEKGLSLRTVLKPGITPEQAAKATKVKLKELLIKNATAAAKEAEPKLRNLKIKDSRLMGAPANRYEHIENLIGIFTKEGKLNPVVSQPFILTDHESVRRVHRKTVDELREWLLTSSGLITTGQTAKKKTEQIFYKGTSQRVIQAGHGAQLGVAVGQIQAEKFLKYRGFTGLEKSTYSVGQVADLEQLRRELNAAFEKSIDARNLPSGKPLKALLRDKDVDQINAHGIHNHFIADTGQFKEEFVTIVSFQSAGSNRVDAAREQSLVAYLRSYLTKNFVDKYDPTKSYSPPLTDRVLAIVTNNVIKKIRKAKGAKVKGTYSSRIKGKEEWQQKIKSEISSKIATEGFPKIKLKKATVRKRTPASSAMSPLNLLAYINARLNKKVAENMGQPALEYRTGRFAESVIATDIIQTREGFPSVGYTYRKDPYQIFEIGAGSPPWATPERDPRPLIDRSIREIAAEVFVGRLYTRRI